MGAVKGFVSDPLGYTEKKVKQAGDVIVDTGEAIVDVGKGAVDVVKDTLKSVTNLAEDVAGSVVKAIDKGIESISTSVENILKDPLPTILMYAGSTVGIPPYVTSAAITAARGGDLKDVATSAAISYATSEMMADTPMVDAEGNPIIDPETGKQAMQPSMVKDVTGDLGRTIGESTSATVGSAVSAGLNTAVVGSVRAALTGKSIGDAFSSGFTSGAIYSGATSLTKAANVDNKWGLSDNTVKLIAGSASASLGALISGKDAPTMVGNYIANAMLNTAGQRLAKEAKLAYQNATKATDKVEETLKAEKSALEAWNKEKDAVQKEVDTYNADLKTFSEKYEKEMKPIEDKLNGYVSEFNTAKAEYDKQLAIYNDTSQSVAVRNAAADAATAAANKANQLSTDAEKYQAANKTTIDSYSTQATNLNARDVSISSKIDLLNNPEAGAPREEVSFNLLGTKVIVVPGREGSVAWKLDKAADDLQYAVDDQAKAVETATVADKKYAEQVAETASKDITLDIIKGGVLGPVINTNAKEGISYFENGLSIDQNGNMFQDGRQIYGTAVTDTEKVNDVVKQYDTYIDPFYTSSKEAKEYADFYGFKPKNQEDLSQFIGWKNTEENEKIAIAEAAADQLFQAFYGRDATDEAKANIKAMFDYGDLNPQDFSTDTFTSRLDSSVLLAAAEGFTNVSESQERERQRLVKQGIVDMYKDFSSDSSLKEFVGKDGSGNLKIYDPSNARVYVFSSDGTPLGAMFYVEVNGMNGEPRQTPSIINEAAALMDKLMEGTEGSGVVDRANASDEKTLSTEFGIIDPFTNKPYTAEEIKKAVQDVAPDAAKQIDDLDLTEEDILDMFAIQKEAEKSGDVGPYAGLFGKTSLDTAIGVPKETPVNTQDMPFQVTETRGPQKETSDGKPIYSIYTFDYFPITSTDPTKFTALVEEALPDFDVKYDEESKEIKLSPKEGTDYNDTTPYELTKKLGEATSTKTETEVTTAEERVAAAEKALASASSNYDKVTAEAALRDAKKDLEAERASAELIQTGAETYDPSKAYQGSGARSVAERDIEVIDRIAKGELPQNTAYDINQDGTVDAQDKALASGLLGGANYDPTKQTTPWLETGDVGEWQFVNGAWQDPTGNRYDLYGNPIVLEGDKQEYEVQPWENLAKSGDASSLKGWNYSGGVWTDPSGNQFDSNGNYLGTPDGTAGGVPGGTTGGTTGGVPGGTVGGTGTEVGGGGGGGGTGGGGTGGNGTYKAPTGTVWGATGQVGEKENLQNQISALKLQQQRSGLISAGQIGLMSLLPQIQNLQDDQPLPNPVVETGPEFDISSPLETDYFGDLVRQKQSQNTAQKDDGTVKIASGGFMDDLLELLHKRG